MLTKGSGTTEVTYWLLKPPTQPRLAGPQWQLAWLHPPGKGPATRGCLLPFKVRAGYRDTPRLRMDAPVWAAGWLQTKVQFPQCHLRGPQQVQTCSPHPPRDGPPLSPDHLPGQAAPAAHSETTFKVAQPQEPMAHFSVSGHLSLLTLWRPQRALVYVDLSY